MHSDQCSYGSLQFLQVQSPKGEGCPETASSSCSSSSLCGGCLGSIGTYSAGLLVMSVIPAILAALAMLAVVGFMALWERWWNSRTVSRALKRVGQPGSRTRLEPESRFIVRLSESEVVCERPDGKVERVAWSDLQKVEIVTTSEGPYVPDVFWVLQGTSGGCAVPQGATGEKELLHRLQALRGFDNGAVIEAMTCVLDRRFLCWQRAA